MSSRLIFDSPTMWTGPVAEGLVDEIHLMISPAALGGGSPLFQTPADLGLLDARRFDGSDNVLLRYSLSR
jgi:riboflavin biosynthesis pyrimidine reductase